MVDSDRGGFMKSMVMLCGAYNETLNDLRTEIYWAALKDLSLEQVQKSILNAIQQNKFFPRVAELRDAAIGNSEDAAESAWLLWKDAARRLGAGASLIVQDAALAETLMAVFGGWPEACVVELSPEMWANKRKEFDRVYRVFTRRELVGSRYLIGNNEKHNSRTPEWEKYTTVGLLADGTLDDWFTLTQAKEMGLLNDAMGTDASSDQMRLLRGMDAPTNSGPCQDD